VKLIIDHCKLFDLNCIVLREEIPTTVSKPVISWFANQELKKLSLDVALEVGIYAIESINANRLIAFEEEVKIEPFKQA
jgi:hypothetical protein